LSTALLWLGIFLLTVAETLISTWGGRADRQSTSAKHNGFSIRAANWEVAFEVVLLIDIYLVVREGWTIIIPIAAGAWLGKYWSLERRRKRWRARVKRKKAV
jgi:xanthine/uracil permease